MGDEIGASIFCAFRSGNSIQDNQPEIPVIESQAGYLPILEVMKVTRFQSSQKAGVTRITLPIPKRPWNGKLVQFQGLFVIL